MAMFYEPDKDDHGLPFNPYKSIVVPRPIGWISTISRDGVENLAPYSQFNNLGYDPPYVMFSGNCFPGTGHRKDSVKNAIFVVACIAQLGQRRRIHCRQALRPAPSQFHHRGLTEARK